jgi:solute carrier family 36 (proton-coupled amino acid transporter)
VSIFRLAQGVKIMFSLAIFITYALQAYVPVDIIWNNYLDAKFAKNPFKLYIELGVRTVLVLITCKALEYHEIVS